MFRELARGLLVLPASHTFIDPAPANMAAIIKPETMLPTGLQSGADVANVSIVKPPASAVQLTNAAWLRAAKYESNPTKAMAVKRRGRAC